MASQFASLFEGTKEEIKSQDTFGGSKIEASGIFKAKITMAKQKDSKSSASKSFVLELETESGAKLFNEFGWYINKAGLHTDKNGKFLPAVQSLVRFTALTCGIQDIPPLVEKSIKEYNFETKSEITVQRMIALDLIGKVVYVQVIRIRSNKQVNSGVAGPDGYNIWVDGPEEKFTNKCQRFYNADSQTVGEMQLREPAENIIKDREYCAKTPVLDKYKAVANTTATQTASAGQPAAGFGGGQAPAQQPDTTGFGQPQ